MVGSNVFRIIVHYVCIMLLATSGLRSDSLLYYRTIYVLQKASAGLIRRTDSFDSNEPKLYDFTMTVRVRIAA
jgi:hypothetical protein